MTDRSFIVYDQDKREKRRQRRKKHMYLFYDFGYFRQREKTSADKKHNKQETDQVRKKNGQQHRIFHQKGLKSSHHPSLRIKHRCVFRWNHFFFPMIYIAFVAFPISLDVSISNPTFSMSAESFSGENVCTCWGGFPHPFRNRIPSLITSVHFIP